MLSLKEIQMMKHADPYSRDMEIAAIAASHVLREINRQAQRNHDLETLVEQLLALTSQPAASLSAHRSVTRTHTKVTIEQTRERIEEF